MATVAPTPAGQGHQGDWYVPVLGMGAGMAAGQGMSRYGSIMDKFMESMRSAGIEGRAALPTTENIASYAGGINAGGSGARAAKLAGKSITDLEEMYNINPVALEKDLANYSQFPRITSQEFLGGGHPAATPTMTGGMVPDKAVLDRVMNSGMRDKILGMGAVAPVMLPPPGVEQGGRHDLLSRLLGIDYPGYKIVQANTGNASQNDQLRQLFGR